jgi:hypothetical protein
MTKQYRLVTEKEYETLKSLRDPPNTILPAAPTLKEEKHNVLLSDFPEEVKNMLYQDFVRRMIRKRKEEEDKPIPVKYISPPSPSTSIPTPVLQPPALAPPTPVRAPLIAKRNLLSDFFQQHGYISHDNLLVFGEKKLSPGQTGSLLRALTDGRVNENIEGFNEAVVALREKNVPLTYLAPSRHIHFTQGPQPGPSRPIKWTKMTIPY